MTTKVWLLALEAPCERRAQSSRARDLLKLVCAMEGLALTENTLELPGLQLIEQFSTRLGLGLSIAHCPGMIAIALAGADVGIDCEQKGRNRNWLGIAELFFTAKEAEVIAASSPSEQESVFLHHWVLKEAYLKVHRGSIFGDLNRLVLEEHRSAKVDGCGSQRIRRAWKLDLFDCPIAVCSASSGPLVIFQVQPPAPGAIEGTIQSLSTSLAHKISLNNLY